jgi:hypothetical protein
MDCVCGLDMGDKKCLQNNNAEIPWKAIDWELRRSWGGGGELIMQFIGI